MSENRVCIAGITGWVGRAVARAVHDAADLQLHSGVSRSAASRDAGEATGNEAWGVPVFGSIEEALEGVDVLVDYTSSEAVSGHVRVALDHGIAVVVGSSGLTAQDYEVIDEQARSSGVGVIAAGNFSLSAALAKAASVLAARYMPDWEIIDYAYAEKPDAPSGTARELAEELGVIRSAAWQTDPTMGDQRSDINQVRGAIIGGSRVHSVRLPSFSVSTEIVFGLPDERLAIRHDASQSAIPYVAGTLLAIRSVHQTAGLIRGLETLLLLHPDER